MIGNVEINNNVFLAPMSGVSDLPFRRVATRFGAGAVVSEMIASEQLACGEDDAVLKTAGEGIAPRIIQLAGREAKWMQVGAKTARDAGADIIDINMGCPAKKVTNGYSGSALMRDLDHAMSLVEATVNAVDCPVTLKMRLGWDDDSLNAGELAARAESAGVQLVTVHGRTRCQFYNGSADWSAIAAVKQAISIPLIANGDVTSLKEAASILDVTGADGLMIGRGSYGKPWLVGHTAHYLATGEMLEAPKQEALSDLILEHYQSLLEHYGVHIGVRAARKHLAWYLEGNKNLINETSKKERLALLTGSDEREVQRQIKQIFSRSPAQIHPGIVEHAA